MEDEEIMELYVLRKESAIQKTEEKYGAFCRKIALHILSVPEDAEECVSDAYMKAWNSIPPQHPDCFQAWLGRVVRNISLDLWRKNHRQKRYAGMEQLLEELEECIPAKSGVDDALEQAELTACLNRWLAQLSKQDRILFLRRYWKGEPLKELARQYHMTPAKLANRMYTLRQRLKTALEQEGISL